MCEPVTIALIAGAVIAAAGTAYQASASAKASKAQARIADMNARIASERADDAFRRGEEEQARVRRESAHEEGALAVQLAGGNLDLSFGSPLDTIVATATINELDANRARTNAIREAQDFDQQEANFTAQAGVHRAAGKNALVGGAIGALGQLVGGAGTAFSSGASSGAIG